MHFNFFGGGRDNGKNGGTVLQGGPCYKGDRDNGIPLYCVFTSIFMQISHKPQENQIYANFVKIRKNDDFVIALETQFRRLFQQIFFSACSKFPLVSFAAKIRQKFNNIIFV